MCAAGTGLLSYECPPSDLCVYCSLLPTAPYLGPVAFFFFCNSSSYGANLCLNETVGECFVSVSVSSVWFGSNSCSQFEVRGPPGFPEEPPRGPPARMSSTIKVELEHKTDRDDNILPPVCVSRNNVQLICKSWIAARA